MHDQIDELFDSLQADLDRLVRIPSVSAAGFDPAFVRESAEATATLFTGVGLSGARLLEVDGAHPAVYGEIAGPAGAPTVLLYAHHDVQPAGDRQRWDHDPFSPVEVGGRLYGRGTSDDKCGIAMHLAAVRVHAANAPVGIKVFIEGEEEIGSPHLESLLSIHGHLLEADVIVIADSGNWRVGRPALTTSLRGLVDCEVEVRTHAEGVHSGMYGGLFPDALTVLTRLLATLHTDDGSVAVAGLKADESPALDLTEEELRSQIGTVDGLAPIGTGSLTSRIWTRPSLSVLAIDAPPVAEAINQLVPVARAKVSLRLAPGEDPDRAMDALTAHLESHADWGAQVTIKPGARGRPISLTADGPPFDAYRGALKEAWNRDPVLTGLGGSIPFAGAFIGAYPEAAVIMTGAADPLSRAHGPNESLDLDELRRACVAEALALASMGE